MQDVRFPYPRWSSLVLALALAACGGDDGGSAVDVDASPTVDGGPEVDAPPACLPALPSAMVIPAGGSMAPASGGLAMMTSTGGLAVYGYDSALHQVVRSWDGTQYATHAVMSDVNGGFGRIALGEVDGRVVVLGDVSDSSTDSDKLRAWIQLGSGAFATGERIANVVSAEVRSTRFDPSTHVLAAAGGDQSHSLLSFERTAAGTWLVGSVAQQSGPGSLYAAGVGTFTDGTAAIAGTGTQGFNLYRRSGTQWSFYRTLASGEVWDARLEFPPPGATGTVAVGVYRDPISHHPRGVFVDLATGMPIGASDLLPEAVNVAAVDSTVVFEPGTARGKILFVDDSFNQPRAWIVSFEGASFTPAQALRPDLVFGTYPHLFYHPCGGYQILHVSRAPTAPADSAPMLLEPLATFAPGL